MIWTNNATGLTHWLVIPDAFRTIGRADIGFCDAIRTDTTIRSVIVDNFCPVSAFQAVSSVQCCLDSGETLLAVRALCVDCFYAVGAVVAVLPTKCSFFLVDAPLAV